MSWLLKAQQLSKCLLGSMLISFCLSESPTEDHTKVHAVRKLLLSGLSSWLRHKKLPQAAKGRSTDQSTPTSPASFKYMRMSRLQYIVWAKLPMTWQAFKTGACYSHRTKLWTVSKSQLLMFVENTARITPPLSPKGRRTWWPEKPRLCGCCSPHKLGM